MRGGWDYINRFPEGVQQVTARQVQDVCRKYFTRDNSTTGVILPEETDGAAAKGPRTRVAAPREGGAG
jgi:predicted Zn-dependent peptidase